MVGFCHSIRLIHTGFLLLLSLIVSVAAFANDSLPKVMSIQANAVDNQIILNLSTPGKASLLSPFEKGERRLLLDIKGASLKDLPDKDALLKSIETTLKDVVRITLDEFRGPEPLVRLTVKTRKPDIQGALIQSEGSVLVLQLLEIQPVMMAKEPVTSPPAAKAESDFSSTTGLEPLPNRIQAPELSAKASVEAAESELERKTFEAESLRRQRNQLDDQISNLKILVDQQNAMIVHLKEEQGRLLASDPKAREKEQIMVLQKELKELLKSYDQMKRVLTDYRREMSDMEDQLRQAQERAAANAEKPAPNNRIQMPQPAESRGGLINTLSSLTQPELDKLLNAEKAFREGKQHELKSESKKAEEKYRQAIGFAPQIPEYVLALATLYIHQKEHNLAQEVLQNALPYHPEDSNLLNELGKVALLKNNPEAALKHFRKALPTGILSNYASTLSRINKTEEAELVYKLAITSRPSDSDLHFNLGNLYLNQKRFQQAEEKFSEALRLNPGFAEAHFHLGLAYVELGKPGMAIEALNSYLKLMPNAPNKSSVQSYLNDLEKTEKRLPKS